MRADNKRTIVYSSTRMRDICEVWLNNHAYANRRSASAEAENVLVQAILPPDPIWHTVTLMVLDGSYDVGQALACVIHALEMDEESGGNRGDDMILVLRTMLGWSMQRGWNYSPGREEYDREWVADSADDLADVIYPADKDCWRENRYSESFFLHDLAEEHRRVSVNPRNFFEIILNHWKKLNINHHHGAYRFLTRINQLTDWGPWTIDRMLQFEELLREISREGQNG